MDEERWCIACRADLAGPFQPHISLVQTAGEEKGDELTISTQAWVCPGCGLVHWYAGDDDMAQLPELVVEDEEMIPSPASSYERRSQMLRMLRRVRRM